MNGKPKTQADIVAEYHNKGTLPEIKTESIRLPGLETLHTKSLQEVAEIITNVLKSRSNLVGIKWMFGSSMELYVKEQE